MPGRPVPEMLRQGPAVPVAARCYLHEIAMLVGYVSDERFMALAEVLLEIEGEDRSIEARSRATGAVHAEIEPGPYRVTLAKAGYGSKSVWATLGTGEPHQFRLLADGLLGYAWPKWVKAGDQAEFRVHSTEPYELSLWRYGRSKTLVRALGWRDDPGPGAAAQVTPDGDYARSGVAWNQHGYTNPASHQFVKAPEESGLYYFHARTAAGRFFAFPWIVAPAEPKAPIAVLASNITWNAYNSFGGRSNAVLADGLPRAPILNARLDLPRYTDSDTLGYDASVYAPLSFDRPEPQNHVDESAQAEDPIEPCAGCHLAAAEWRLLSWLERECLPYDFYAETQLHSGMLDLDRYKVLVLSTHPEFWSREMFRRVKAWVGKKGGRLVYLGGGGINCEVEFPDPATMLCKNGDRREIERRGLESRFHLGKESEASLLGVGFTEAGLLTAAPYRVIEGDHWVFEGTGLRTGDTFGTQSLHTHCPGGASGHQTDKILPSSPPNVLLLAEGLNPEQGGAHMVYYETSGGGAVFSAGSIAYPSALLVDECASMITATVLRRLMRS